jgi:hypothetical protein
LPTAQENYWEEVNHKDYSVTKDTFLYDRNGYLSKEWFMVNDSILYKIQYKTDGIGGIIEMKRLFADYHLTNKIYYNIQGLVEQIDEYDPHNKIYKYFTFEYDNHGNELNRRIYKSHNELLEYTYTQYNNEKLLQKVIFEDLLHNLREDKVYSQHDAQGNWLIEIVIQENDTVRKRIRKIEYYY